MPRNLISESFTNNERVSFDPTDIRAFERLHARQILQGENALMLAILENAVEYFQKYLFAQSRMDKSYFKKQRNGSSIKIAMSFFPSSLSARSLDYTRITYVTG